MVSGLNVLEINYSTFARHKEQLKCFILAKEPSLLDFFEVTETYSFVNFVRVFQLPLEEENIFVLYWLDQVENQNEFKVCHHNTSLFLD